MPSFFDRIGRLLGKGNSSASSRSAAPSTNGANGEDWRPRVLCVDDDDAVLKLLHRQLSGTYHVTIAHSGSEGIVALQEQPAFDVIVSDLKMRQVSGLAFLIALAWAAVIAIATWPFHLGLVRSNRLRGRSASDNFALTNRMRARAANACQE